MANPTKKNGGKIYLQCKECQKFKSVCEKNWYLHPQGYMGVLGRCRKCILSGRKTEHELQMARERDRKRYKENQKRNEYIKNKAISQIKTVKGKARTIVSNYIKGKSIRPTVCPICMIEPLNKRIEAHHFDYSKPLQIIFACSICHSKLDMGKINYKKCKIVDLSKF